MLCGSVSSATLQQLKAQIKRRGHIRTRRPATSTSARAILERRRHRGCSAGVCCSTTGTTPESTRLAAAAIICSATSCRSGVATLRKLERLPTTTCIWQGSGCLMAPTLEASLRGRPPGCCYRAAGTVLRLARPCDHPRCRMVDQAAAQAAASGGGAAARFNRDAVGGRAPISAGWTRGRDRGRWPLDRCAAAASRIRRAHARISGPRLHRWARRRSTNSCPAATGCSSRRRSPAVPCRAHGSAQVVLASDHLCLRRGGRSQTRGCADSSGRSRRSRLRANEGA